MKKLLMSLVLIFSVFFSFGNVDAYKLNKNDFNLIKKVEVKIFDFLEKKNISPEKIVKIIRNIINNKAKSERVKEIFLKLEKDLTFRYALNLQDVIDDMSMYSEEWSYKWLEKIKTTNFNSCDYALWAESENCKRDNNLENNTELFFNFIKEWKINESIKFRKNNKILDLTLWYGVHWLRNINNKLYILWWSQDSFFVIWRIYKKWNDLVKDSMSININKFYWIGDNEFFYDWVLIVLPRIKLDFSRLVK